MAKIGADFVAKWCLEHPNVRIFLHNRIASFEENSYIVIIFLWGMKTIRSNEKWFEIRLLGESYNFSLP